MFLKVAGRVLRLEERHKPSDDMGVAERTDDPSDVVNSLMGREFLETRDVLVVCHPATRLRDSFTDCTNAPLLDKNLDPDFFREAILLQRP